MSIRIPWSIRRPQLAFLAWALASRTLYAGDAPGPLAVWVEAEAHARQEGASAPKFDMPTASGGACVDNGWGGREGDLLRYEVDLPRDIDPLVVTLRYARETPGESLVRVRLDAHPAKAVLVKLPCTRDWGFRPEGWRYAEVRLPAAAKGRHAIEILSEADRNNVNLDGFYLGDRSLEAAGVPEDPPRGPDALAPLGEGLCPLSCKTPLALPGSRWKAYVGSDGLVGSLVYREDVVLGAAWTRVDRLGPALHVLLAGRGPWSKVEQRIETAPVPTVVTRFRWPEVRMEQAVLPAAPESEGFRMRVTLSNVGDRPAELEAVSLLLRAPDVTRGEGARLSARGGVLLRALPAGGVSSEAVAPALPGPLGAPRLRHRVALAAGASAAFDIQFLGGSSTYDEARAAASKVWEERLSPAARIRIPDPKVQLAFDASLRQILAMIEPRPDHARVLKGLQHYYGANPYDTFQASRALDAVGLRADAREILRHQLAHLQPDGIFEMWEKEIPGAGVEQWIVQGLAAAALWGHHERWEDADWLKEIAPILIKAAQATLKAREEHAGVRAQGNLKIEGWLPPVGGDGGLGVGYHWSQNAGPLAGVRIAAEAARRLGRPEAEELREGYEGFQKAMDAVRRRAAEAAGLGMIPAFPGAEGAERTRPLWGAVMSVTTFGAIPGDDPAAVGTLRFLQQNKRGGLHLNLGYSRGVWPYLSAEVALWHARLGEFDEAWRVLRAIVDRASPTICWYEEIEEDPPRGHGDPADVWAAAEMVYLTRRLIAWEEGDELRLAPGLPAEWMEEGRRLEIGRLPCAGGECSAEIRYGKGGGSADIRLAGERRPARIRLTIAPSASAETGALRVEGAAAARREGREAVIDSPASTVRVAWGSGG